MGRYFGLPQKPGFEGWSFQERTNMRENEIKDRANRNNVLRRF